jgi:FAD dependent monooxygenase
MTAELGLGANIAIESAISLCNILQRFVTTDQTATSSSSSPNNKSPNPALQSQLTSLFAAYQSQRFDRAKAFVNLCGKITRSRSYDTWWNRIFITRIATLPWMQKFQVGKFIKAFSESPKLEYVGTRTINEGAEGWKLGAEKTKGGLERAWVVYAVLTVAVGVSSYVAISKLGMSM